MRLKRALRTSAAAICIAAVLTPPTLALPQAARAPLDVRFGQAEDFTRVEFHWAGGARYRMTRDGQVVTVRFSRDANPDIAQLRHLPPRWVRTAAARHEGGALIVDLTLAEGVDARMGEADGAIFVNVFPRTAAPPDAAAAAASAAAAAAAAAEARASRPNPVPTDGVVRVQAAVNGPQVRFDFVWRAPLGAAVFRRGDAVWVIFDTQARYDLSRVPQTGPQMRGVTPIQGPGWSGLRIATRGPVSLAAQDNGSGWTVTLAPASLPPFTPLQVNRTDEDGPAGLQAAVSGATGVFWIDDPSVGDRFAAITALGPAKGLLADRDFLQLSLLRSAQGLVVAPRADGVNVGFDGDLVNITREGGLALSPRGTGENQPVEIADAPRPAPLPTLIDPDWAEPAGGFLPRYNRLLAAMAEEQQSTRPGQPTRQGTAAHMALARFLVGNQLSYEAIGVLNDAARLSPQLASDPEFRGLRGIARVMARRYTEAATDLASPALTDDPGAAAWRGYIAAQTGQWEDVKREMVVGRRVFAQFAPLWRTRFAAAAARAAIEAGDNDEAQIWIAYACAGQPDVMERLPVRLLQGRLLEAQGERTRALGVYLALMRAPTDDITAPATLRATQIRLDLHQISPLQAAQTFDALRFRWRGDGFELETIRTLGQLYLSQGRYREALETFRSAGARMPNLPQAVQLQADLTEAFKALFLEGQADGLEPVQALALFYDFRELTPVGADGDLMVRRLVRRLVDVDLLDQAETLLRYQVENRLDGVAKADVATDLAVIYLMDRRPEDALLMINSTRTTILPAALNAQRRLVTARALSALGRYEAALEMLGADASAEGVDVRAEITWRQHSWPGAGAAYERALGERWRTPTTPLSVDEEGKLLRAAVSYSLAGDEAGTARLREHFQPFVAGSRNPDALRVALTGSMGGPLGVSEFSRVTADNAAFEGWVTRMKARFRQIAAQPLVIPPRRTTTAEAPAAAPAAAPPRQAAAAPAPTPAAPGPRAG